LHGYDPAVAMITVKPRDGEDTIRIEDIIKTIEIHGESTALVLFSGVQYYTGQLFDIPQITTMAQSKVSLQLIKILISVGMQGWLGFSSCCWQCRVETSRLER
jgi:kynureninase